MAKKKSARSRPAVANPLRSLPQVDALLNHALARSLAERHGRSTLLAAVRAVLDDTRRRLLGGEPASTAAPDAILETVRDRLDRSAQPSLRRVVNATGIILHTGLGRAPMPDAAAAALATVVGYGNVQMDLETGERSRREACVREVVRELTGAEDALVVNNNAGATLLVLQALAAGREVVVSRGELIEIGGSFRLPEIMGLSGAIMREVGATNKTHLRDYEKAVGPATAILFKAHKSNYRIVGFTKEVGIADIARLGKARGVVTVDDLGCGALVPLETYGLEHEMTMRESLEAGADLVLSSTDKLIGGPQGGLIIGRKDLLERVKSHPLYRALRVCKLTLAGLETVLKLFRNPERLPECHPVYALLARTPDAMQAQAEALAARIAALRPDWRVDVTKEDSFLGGGSLPGSVLPSVAVRIASDTETAEQISRRLRTARVPVIPHVREGTVLLNLRTIFADDSDAILASCGKER